MKSSRKGVGKKNKAVNNNVSATKVPAPNRGLVIRTRAGPPKITTLSDSVTLSNSELLTSLSVGSSGVYLPQRIFLAPYQTAFCNGIGQNFQRYRFEYLRFVYIPSVASNTGGVMFMSYGTDHRDAAPGNSSLQMVSAGAITGPVWAGYDGGAALTHMGNISSAIALDFPTNLRTGYQYYMTTGAGFVALNGSDRNDASPGYLDLGTEAGSFNGVVGKIYMVYKVKFWCPISSTQQV